MAKALLGTHTTPRTVALLDEIRSLRARVAELEKALAEAAEAEKGAADSPRALGTEEETLVSLDAQEPVKA